MLDKHVWQSHLHSFTDFGLWTSEKSNKVDNILPKHRYECLTNITLHWSDVCSCMLDKHVWQSFLHSFTNFGLWTSTILFFKKSRWMRFYGYLNNGKGEHIYGFSEALLGIPWGVTNGLTTWTRTHSSITILLGWRLLKYKYISSASSGWLRSTAAHVPFHSHIQKRN